MYKRIDAARSNDIWLFGMPIQIANYPRVGFQALRGLQLVTSRSIEIQYFDSRVALKENYFKAKV